MQQKTTVLIADDNKSFLSIFSDFLTQYPDIEIAGAAENGAQLLELLNTKKPDVLLLDIVMPSMDGLEVLKMLKNMEGKKPAVFVVSALSTEAVTRQALALGALYYFIKPLDMEALVSKIQTLHIDENGNGQPGIRPAYKYSEDTRALDEHIYALLHTLNIPANVQGFHFLRDMISLYMRRKQNENANELYRKIAKQYSTTPLRVQKAVTYAIEAAWNRHTLASPDSGFGIFLKAKGVKPTNLQFLRMAADKIKTAACKEKHSD